MPDLGILGIVAAIIAVIVVLVLLRAIAAGLYKRVPPSRAMVIYGRGQTRFVTGGGTFIIPIFEEFQFLDLTVKTVKKEKDEVYTVDGVPILLDWVAQVQVANNRENLDIAARAFLGKTADEVQSIITETLSANFRAIVGRMSVEGIHRDRDAFVLTVQELASDDMAAMGVKIISMGIEEITDGQGYFQAMAAPQIAAIKRDAKIAEAEADRAARVKAATATREAEQAELEAQRQILEQKQAFQLREVEMEKFVGMEKAKTEQEVERERARAVEQQQEADVLVPARAKREATEIEADAERRKHVIVAEAESEAIRKRAEANASAVQQAGIAEADRLRALKSAEAEATRATLLAEAEGRTELAKAASAEGEINLRQFIIETLAKADVEKTAHIAEALAGVGQNVKIVQFAGGNGNGISSNGHSTGVTLIDVLMNIPEMAEVLSAKTEALSGSDIETQIARVLSALTMLREAGSSRHESNGESSGETNGGRRKKRAPKVVEVDVTVEDESETSAN